MAGTVVDRPVGIVNSCRSGHGEGWSGDAAVVLKGDRKNDSAT